MNEGFPDIDIEFTYTDADICENEIAELYSYTEVPEFQLNLKAFEEISGQLNVVPLWQSLSEKGRYALVVQISDYLELCDATKRSCASRAILYIVQGCWGEVQSDTEQIVWARKNVFLLYECGIWSLFLQLLLLEIESTNGLEPQQKTSVSVSLDNSANLRVILSVLYTIAETLRVPCENDSELQSQIRDNFKEELSQPQNETGEPVAMTLLGMVTRFCSSSAPHYPIRKVLLLLWKVLLVSLGGIKEVFVLKNELRVKAGLEPVTEDIYEIVQEMRPSTPPPTGTDGMDPNNFKKGPLRRRLMKQSSLDDNICELTLVSDDDERPQVDPDEPGDLPRPPSPRPYAPPPPPPSGKSSKGLPWTPKVRGRDIDCFLDSTRVKFVGFPLKGDRTSLAGLPLPIHEGVNVLQKHVYVSLSEIQIKREEEILSNPFSQPEDDDVPSPAEIFYQAMRPSLQQCMIALLKILLAASPLSKAKTDSINIMVDVLPKEMPVSFVESMKLGLDVNRHKEVIVKAVSGSLFLILKHFKVNHIYQFEAVSQHLVFANCVPLILKYFNQNILDHIQAKNNIALFDFPACVIGDPPDLTAKTLQVYADGGTSRGNTNTSDCDSACESDMESSAYCWRNMFSSINLLRILNKLCKWKHSRIMLLVLFKSSPILKKALKVRHAMFQLYVLKLLKMQTKYLGRQWRKNNMKTMSAIYQKVRHRLNDDWAYGNDPDARPWEFQVEECGLKSSIEKFNNRRYSSSFVQDPDFMPMDNCIMSVLGRKVELTDDFKRHYEVWLQREVHSTNIDWDQLLQPGLIAC